MGRGAWKHREHILVVFLLHQSLDLRSDERGIPVVIRTVFFIGCESFIFLTQEEVLADTKYPAGVDRFFLANGGKFFPANRLCRQSLFVVRLGQGGVSEASLTIGDDELIHRST